MASEASDKRLERLKKELEAAEKVYKSWRDEFKVDKLEAFVVRSKQRKNPKGGEQLDADSYQVNLLAPSLAARIPALMFDRPHALVTPKDPMADDALMAQMAAPPMPGMPAPLPPLSAADKAKLREDLLNTIIQDQGSRFINETELGIREAFFRFGMVEVIYTAEYEDSGAKGKTVTLDEKDGAPPKAEEEQEVEAAGDTKEDQLEGEAELDVPSKLPKPGSERIKFRRIPAAQVRVSCNQKNDLERCDWVGYFEWMYLSDIKARSDWQNRTKVKATHSNSSQNEDKSVEAEDKAPADGMVKVWKVWDIRTKKRFVWPDSEEFFFVDGKHFDYLPMAALYFEPLLDQFYPVPPAFYWTGPQIEYNETRDMQRVHRRRALRKFVYNQGAFQNPEELAKLASGEDMAFAEIVGNVPASNAIFPVQVAPMDPISVQQIQLTMAEIQQTTKVGGEQRQMASSDTATQANIISMNKQIQDTTDRNKVAAWLQKLCWIALRTAEENFTTQAVIKTSVDPTGAGAQREGQRVAETWKAIEMDQLGELEYQVDIDIESLAPPSSTIKAQQSTQMMATLSNPNVLAILAQPEAEPFVRQFLAVQGYKDETQVQAIIGTARAIIQQAQAAQAAAAAPQGMPPGGPGLPPGAPTPEGGGIPTGVPLEAVLSGMGA